MSHPHPELTSPPALARNAVRIIALGGLGEVGRNMTVIEHAENLVAGIPASLLGLGTSFDNLAGYVKA